MLSGSRVLRKFPGLRRTVQLSTHNTPQHSVSSYDGFVLKITGLSKGTTPTSVSVDRMEKATSRFRIGLMFVMMGFSVVGSVYAILLGKKDRANHVNSLAQQNRDRHARAKK